MSRNLPANVQAALTKPVIETAVLARLEFQTGPVFIWTGGYNITVTGHVDQLLNGNTFTAVEHGVVLGMGENNFTMEGSTALEITLAIPFDVSSEINATMYDKTEFQARPIVLWRAVLLSQGQPGVPPAFGYRRIRSGTMDVLRTENDGSMRKWIMSVESHAGMLSRASGSTYLSQREFDPNDSSQDFAVAIANGKPYPVSYSGGSYGYDYGGGGGFGGGDGGYRYDVQQN